MVRVDIIAVGNSSGVIIPKRFLKSHGIEEGDAVEIEVDLIDSDNRERYQELKKERKGTGRRRRF